MAAADDTGGLARGHPGESAGVPVAYGHSVKLTFPARALGSGLLQFSDFPFQGGHILAQLARKQLNTHRLAN